MKTMLSLLAAFAAILGSTPSHAATVPVTVTVNSVRNISAGDTWSQPPDFYARIWIDGSAIQTPTVQNSNGFTSPAGWTITRAVSRTGRGGFAPVRIQLFDADDRLESPNGDPMVDIDPAGCSGGFPFGCAEVTSGTSSSDSFGIDVTLNLFNGAWAPVDLRGDSTMGPAPTPGVGQMACTTGSGQNVANVCFTITVGTSSAETLTVRKTTDSDRGFCAPTDCSLREAITRAESGDTVQLRAAASPYLLDAHGDVHLAIRQPLLTVQGPTTGGTAVIRQTRGDFRVFDVHAGAKLVMSHVTVTGGGAGHTSTAYAEPSPWRRHPQPRHDRADPRDDHRQPRARSIGHGRRRRWHLQRRHGHRHADQRDDRRQRHRHQRQRHPAWAAGSPGPAPTRCATR